MTDRKVVHKKSSGFAPMVGAVVACLVLAAAACYVVFAPFDIDMAHAVADSSEKSTAIAAKAETSSEALDTGQASATGDDQHLEKVLASIELRMQELEKILPSIKTTGKMAEERSLDNKIMARELIRYIRIMVLVLLLIAIGFPLMIWLLSRRRLLGLSGLSSELAATMVVVEERQAKLANILKDIQGEIDYLHNMSVPDLKDLIQQAENYLKQNEKDLEKAGVTRNRTQPRQ